MPLFSLAFYNVWMYFWMLACMHVLRWFTPVLQFQEQYWTSPARLITELATDFLIGVNQQGSIYICYIYVCHPKKIVSSCDPHQLTFHLTNMLTFYLPVYLTCIFSHIFWHSRWHSKWCIYIYCGVYIYIFWHCIWYLFGILSGMYSDILSDACLKFKIHSIWYKNDSI